MKRFLMIVFAAVMLISVNVHAEIPCDATMEVTISTAPPVCQCAYLCQGVITAIHICGGPGAGYPPLVTITPGCYTVDRIIEGCDDETCPPAEYIFDPSQWTYDPTANCWNNYIIPLSNGCVCVCFDDYLPVQLASFNAVPIPGKVQITWVTASELNNDYFELLRDGGLLTRVASHGNSAASQSYSVEDDQAGVGVTYAYTLLSVNMQGVRQELGTVNAAPGETGITAQDYALHQNYPNPFNPLTTIAFDLKEAGIVSLKVYNLNGQEVAALINGTMSAGTKTVQFNAANLPSGVYWYKLESNGFVATRKMLLMK